MMKNLDQYNFVVFDVETTGLSPQSGDRVVEIAALKVENFKVVDRFTTLINPEREVSYGAFLVNGITSEMVSGAPKAAEILPDFLKFINDSIFIGHNIKFDLGFLNNEVVLAGLKPLENYVAIDTIKMSRGFMPQLGKYSLSIVASALGIKEEQKHRAMSDVDMTYSVFTKLLDIAQQKEVKDFEDILHLFNTKRMNRIHIDVKVQKITHAITSKLPLQIVYFGVNSGLMARQVTPMKLIGEGNNRSLEGYCHLRKEPRTFKLNRIVNLEQVN